MAGNGFLSGRGGGERGYPARGASYEPTEPYEVDPYQADAPGNTRAFPVGEPEYLGNDGRRQPYPPGRTYPDQGYAGAGDPTYPDRGYPDPAYPYAGEPYAGEPYAGDPGHADDPTSAGSSAGSSRAEDHVATYRAGGRTAPRATGPRLPWRELLIGIYRAPARTFDQMRDHQVWLPALSVSLLYGVLAVLGFGDTHNEVVNATLSTAVWSMLLAAFAFSLVGLTLGAVTYALARQLGGAGPWAATVGLSVLIGWTSDVPRLLLALFLPSGNPVVQLVGWLTWAFCAVLLTTLIRRVHDLPWGKAAGAVSLQLLVLLVLLKLPTLG
ncbi:Yip1 family protein [Kitasatospora sp. LaBMicrA B282]|uniref:Yip1 family protein n=1 Tax=Kitasatospora sp. LaBMicrA B282 TaxID=3420949 RepID=UPI003D09E801